MKVTDNEHFRGNNKLTAMTSYYYRLLYSAVHTPNTKYKKIKKNVKNFEYGEHILYGRVKPFSHIPVIIKEDRLAAPKRQDPTKVVHVANFVADAYDDFVNSFETAQYRNQISMEGGFLTSPVARKGYQSPTQHYRAYSTAAFEVFQKYLTENRLHGKIKDFDSFYIQFHNYFKLFCKALPFTLEAFHRSNLSNVNMTGLAIDLAEFDAAEDKIKVERVFSNVNYQFYENAALQHGFSIDKNCPWRIVADLGSPARLRYMAKYNIRNATRLMNSYYEPAYLVSYNAFKTMLVNYYNNYARSRPEIVKPRRNGLGDYVSKIETIETVSIFDMIRAGGEKYFLEKYVIFRSMEESGIFTKQKIVQIVDRAMEIANIRGMESALKYINEAASKTPQRSGSIAYRANKNLKKAIEKEEQSDLAARGKTGY